MASDKKYNAFPVVKNCTVVIASSTTVSTEVDLTNCQLAGVHVPATFDGTTFTITVSPVAGGTSNTLKDATGTAVTYTTAASSYLGLTDAQISQLSGARYIKIVTGTAQTTTDTILQLACTPRIQ